MYTHTCMCMYAHTLTHTQNTHTCMHLHTCMHGHTLDKHTNMCTCTHRRAHTRTHTHTHARAHTLTHKCTSALTHTHACAHTHTHYAVISPTLECRSLTENCHNAAPRSVSEAAWEAWQRQQLLKYSPPRPSSSLATAQYTVVAAPCCWKTTRHHLMMIVMHGLIRWKQLCMGWSGQNNCAWVDQVQITVHGCLFTTPTRPSLLVHYQWCVFTYYTNKTYIIRALSVMGVLCTICDVCLLTTPTRSSSFVHYLWCVFTYYTNKIFIICALSVMCVYSVSYTHLRAHETG